MSNNTNCILFFVKYPEKGKVKTRISAQIGESPAVSLYRNFILDLLTTLNKIEVPLYICYYPRNSKRKFFDWLGTEYNYMLQKGRNLGEKMKNAFFQVFKNDYDKVIVMGSDSPDLTREIIIQALSSLETNDVVIGPSFDGGYYLLGFRKNTFYPYVFKGIKWSTNSVFENTINILNKKGYKIKILNKWQDIDIVDDLKILIDRNRKTEFKNSKTIKYLSELNLSALQTGEKECIKKSLIMD